MSSDDDNRNQQLNEIIAEYLQAVEEGTAPDSEAWLSAHDDLADELRIFLEDHKQLQTAVGSAEEATLRPELATIEDETLAPDHGQATNKVIAPSGASTTGTNVRYFGDYELLEEIARGGMGVVYKARQVSLNRIVALKMILAGQLAGEEDVKRFHAEAEAAANLDHPGIVPIHEIGVHDGQHYFSMGFVEGNSLADRIKDGPLPPREAADYTRKVAEAVAFAHEQGVIHRDLKPGNVLLDRHGEPKVTDFGLAKRVEGESDLTATGQILGTPSYMPPEQASGKVGEVNEAADVYSLGAVLYALLTGRPPFQSDSSLDTLLQVLEQEPVSPRVLNPKVPQDLETICLKSLQKDRRRRYISSEQLAQELGRFLNGEPIQARPISAVARGWRWCRRKPIVASLITATAVSLIAGMLVSSYFAVLAARRANEAISAKKETDEALQAESQARSRTQEALVAATLAKNQARQAVDNYVDLVTTDVALSERRFQPLRRRLLDDALKYYQWLSDTSRANRTNRLNLAEACQNLGRVHLSSGSAEKGHQSLQEAVQILRELSEQDPPVDEAQRQLPGALNLLGQLAMELSRTSEAIEHYHEAIEIDRALADRHPENQEYLSELAADYNNLGEAHRRIGDNQAAEQSFRRAIEIKQQLVESDPDNVRWREALGNSYNNLGILQIPNAMWRKEALDAAIELREKLAAQQPDNARYRDNLASSYFNLGNFSRDPAQALKAFKKARLLHEQLLREDPNVPRYRFNLAKDLLNSAEVHIRLQDMPSAEDSLSRSIQLHQQLIAEQPEVPEYQHSLATCHGYVATLWKAKGDYPAAKDEMQKSVAILQRLVRALPDRERYQSALAFAYYRLGDLLYNQVQDREAALKCWQDEVKLREQMVGDHPDQPRQLLRLGGSLNNVAMILEELGNTVESAELYAQAVRHQQNALKANPQDGQVRGFLTNHLSGLSRTRRTLGQWSAAVLAARELIDLWPGNPEGLYRGAAELARCVQVAEAANKDEESVIDEQELNSVRHQAIEALKAAVSAGFTDARRLDQDTAWTPFQNDEHFIKLKQKVAAEGGAN